MRPRLAETARGREVDELQSILHGLGGRRVVESGSGLVGFRKLDQEKGFIWIIWIYILFIWIYMDIYGFIGVYNILIYFIMIYRDLVMFAIYMDVIGILN